MNNDTLENLSGLDNLKNVGLVLNIRGNDSLKNLEGLENLSHVQYGLQIGGIENYGITPGNMSLETLKGLDNLTYVGHTLNIYDNNSLPQCEVDNWFEQLTVAGKSVTIYPNGDTNTDLCALTIK